MGEFLLALAVFVAAHVLPARTGLKDWLTGRIGRPAYLAAYSLLSIALIVWLIAAAIRAPAIPLWTVSIAHYWFALILMLPASMLIVGGVFSPNPLSVGFAAIHYDPARPGIVGVTRHPLLWGFALWAIAHIPANGDLVALIMFGGFALFALAGMAATDARKRRQLGIEWSRLAAPTSVIPFAAWFWSRAAKRWPPGAAVVTLLGGPALYLLLLWLHPRLIGPDPGALLL